MKKTYPNTNGNSMACFPVVAETRWITSSNRTPDDDVLSERYSRVYPQSSLSFSHEVKE